MHGRGHRTGYAEHQIENLLLSPAMIGLPRCVIGGGEGLMDLGLTDKVAVVTGSSRGLGLASARSLAAEGCRVCICARGEERLRAAAIEVGASAGDAERVLPVVADLSTLEGVKTVIDRAVATFGGLDILVNNIGLAGGGTLLETSDAQW